jgi:hypothetical protein
MLKKALYSVFLIVNLSLGQNTIGTTQISQGVLEGFTLFTLTTKTYLINNCGELINHLSSNFTQVMQFIYDKMVIF